ncbi:MAG: hypothetical protein EXR79_01870 [Myxococcales bacterium]|nr:hypothetical protein [Myxococcales bacterium]
MNSSAPLPGPGSRLRVPWAALLRAGPGEIASLSSRHADSRIVVVGRPVEAWALVDAAALHGLCQAASGRVVVVVEGLPAAAAPAELAALAAAGVAGVEAMADGRSGRGPAWADAAGACGLALVLRWALTEGAVAALDALRRGAVRPPECTELVIEPWLPDGEGATARSIPCLGRVQAAWPRRAAVGATALGAGGPLLVRSLLWPAHLHADADATESVPGPAAMRAAALLAARSDRVASRSARHPTQHPARAVATSTPWFEPRAPEARGLALGLRSAWRIHVPLADVAALEAALAGHGLRCAAGGAGHERDVGGGWTSLDTPAGAALVVMARSAAVARRCLDLELANLARPAPRTPAELRASVGATLASHRALGAAYGYPACCVEAFCDAHAEVLHGPRAGDNAQVVLRAWLRTRRFDARLDVLAGPMGAAYRTPLRHLPCRFDCRASLSLHARLARPSRRSATAEAGPRRTETVVVVFADGSFVRLPGARAEQAADGTCTLSGVGAWEPGLGSALRPYAAQVARGFGAASVVVRAGHLPVPVGTREQGPELDALAAAVQSPFPLVLPFA